MSSLGMTCADVTLISRSSHHSTVERDPLVRAKARPITSKHICTIRPPSCAFCRHKLVCYILIQRSKAHAYMTKAFSPIDELTRDTLQLSGRIVRSHPVDDFWVMHSSTSRTRKLVPMVACAWDLLMIIEAQHITVNIWDLAAAMNPIGLFEAPSNHRR